MPSNRLDVYLGADLLAWLESESQASDQSKAEIIKAALRDRRLGQAGLAGEVRAAVLTLAQAIEPSEIDPAEDMRAAEALNALARLLGSAYAAQGIADALAQLWTARHLPEPDGLVLNGPVLAWLDELVDRAPVPHTRETMVEKLIGEAWYQRVK